MFEPIEVYISDKYTYQDYLKLNFKVDSYNNEEEYELRKNFVNTMNKVCKAN